MFQNSFETYTSTPFEYQKLNQHTSNMNITFEYLHQKIIEKPLEEGQDLGCFSDDSLSTKDSEENLDCSLKKTAISQKKSYKKAP